MHSFMCIHAHEIVHFDAPECCMKLMRVFLLDID
jgi:hypothetical protein